VLVIPQLSFRTPGYVTQVLCPGSVFAFHPEAYSRGSFSESQVGELHRFDIFSIRIIICWGTVYKFESLRIEHRDHIALKIISETIEESPVDWAAIEEGIHGTLARKAKYTLRLHQQEAFDKAIAHYKKNDRGQMIMACGTGKTFTSLRIAEALSANGNRCVLFLAPSIALVGQTLREWTANAENDLNIIAVCSDPKVTKKKINDDMGEHVEDLGAPATTDPQRILELYKAGEGLTVIFSKYQSIDAVINAQKAGLPAFDLIISDEAHRTTGAIGSKENEKYFTKVHSDDNIRGKKRLYMTATPRIYGVKGKETAKEESITLCSMDDPETYGTEFYKIGFGEAVERDLLSNYKVLILTIRNSDMPDVIKRKFENEKYGADVDTDTASKVWGCMNALAKNLAYDETVKNTDPGKMKSAVTFAKTIAASKDLTEIFNSLSESPMAPVELGVKHIDGSMNAFKREELLTWLKEGDQDCRVLSNVRCLSEGVDVPALDAVMFLSNKNSLIDIVQSVGRVMRRAPGKKYGYIIIPVIAPEGTSASAALDDDEQYNVVWQVLRALRSHDERLEAEVNTLQYSKGRSGRILPARLMRRRRDGTEDDYDGDGASRQYLLDDFETALMARLVLKVGDRNYIENWAKDVAVIMPDLIERLTKICRHEDHGYKQFRPAFTKYLKGLRANINGNVSEDDAINMLAQQIITKPIFTELFGNDTFVQKNTVSSTINEMLDEIGEKDALKGIELETFYNNVKNTLSRIDRREGKQKVITALYEKFFKNAFPKDQAISGVVYTPTEIVDFILRSAADILKEEFDIDINDIRAKNKQKSLFDDTPSLIRHDGVSDYALKTAKSKYGSDVTKEDIFYYVYGYLHSPEYLEAFSEDLKLSLPRIDLIDDYDEFRIFSDAGRNLAELHTNYENAEPPESLRLSGSVDIKEIINNDDFCRVKKMRALPEEGKVIYNKNIVIENIPKEAFEYVVNGRSAIECIVDQYQYKEDKESGIVNDPNEYAGGNYVFRLLRSVIGVSVKTMEIVKSLPKLKFEEGK
jgi:predicted helicase